MDKSSLNEQSVALPKNGETVAMQHHIKLTCDDMTTISRSKLDHLKDLADDDRMNEPEWSVDRIFGSIAGGAFFTSAGGFLCYPQLPDYGKFLCLIGLVGGFFLSIYCFYREYTESEKRKNHRDKLVKKIDQIISSIEYKN
jgi:hypothetical protein